MHSDQQHIFNVSSYSKIIKPIHSYKERFLTVSDENEWNGYRSIILTEFVKRAISFTLISFTLNGTREPVEVYANLAYYLKLFQKEKKSNRLWKEWGISEKNFILIYYCLQLSIIIIGRRFSGLQNIDKHILFYWKR